MVHSQLSRRNLLKTSALALTASSLGLSHSQNCSAASSVNSIGTGEEFDFTSAAKSIRYCLNTSTIRGKKIPIEQEVELVAKAGYTGIEPWINEINDYKKKGNSLNDLKKKIADLGLKVESAIGFAQWIVDDPEKRKKALEQAKRDMELVAAIGGTRIAAPPSGATNSKGMDLFEIAKRYGELLKVGAEVGVRPQLELWGFSKTLSRLGETAFVITESGRSDSLLLPDVYHIYKGGSDFSGLKSIEGRVIEAFHMNDYPDMPIDKINDSDRVYPGDGVAPLKTIIRTLLQNGFAGAFSLELFNREYWKQEAKTVLETGLRKMKETVANAVE